MDCIENIIGLSKNDCPCISDNQNDLVVNGGFENDLSGWTGDWGWKNGLAQVNAGTNPNDVLIEQSISVDVGKEYTLTFDAFSTGSDVSPTAINLQIAGISSGHEYSDLNLSGPNSYTFVADESSLNIRFFHVSEINQSQIDNVSILVKATDESLTSLYIDDNSTQGIKVKALADTRNCKEANEVWNVLKEIRQQAIDEFQEAFYVMLSKNLKKHSDKTYNIGDLKKGTGALATLKYPFACLTPYKTYRGQEVHVNGVKLHFSGNYTDTIPFWIYANGDSVYSGNMIMTNGKGSLKIGVTLPVVDEYNQVIDYRLVYDQKGGFPMDYKWNCGCGSSRRDWEANWQMSSGSVSNIEEVEDATCQTTNSMGLQISASVHCNPLLFLCSLDYSQKHGFPAVIGTTIQMIARKLLALHLLNSNKVNEWTLLKVDELNQKIEFYNEQITWRLEWLTEQYNSSHSDCFKCSDSYHTRLIDIGG